jgi:hypothetical protein
MQDDKLCGQALEHIEKAEMPTCFFLRLHIAYAIPFGRIHCASGFEAVINNNKTAQKAISSKYIQ